MEIVVERNLRIRVPIIWIPFEETYCTFSISRMFFQVTQYKRFYSKDVILSIFLKHLKRRYRKESNDPVL